MWPCIGRHKKEERQRDSDTNSTERTMKHEGQREEVEVKVPKELN